MSLLEIHSKSEIICLLLPSGILYPRKRKGTFQAGVAATTTVTGVSVSELRPTTAGVRDLLMCFNCLFRRTKNRSGFTCLEKCWCNLATWESTKPKNNGEQLLRRKPCETLSRIVSCTTQSLRRQIQSCWLNEKKRENHQYWSKIRLSKR